MNWEALGAIAELVGAAAVVITLVYLSIQMKTNTSAINRASNQSVVQGRTQTTQFLASDPAISDLLWKGADHPEELSDSEWRRFFLIVSLTLRPIELAFLDHVDGRMSAEMWQGQENTIKYWIHRPGFQRWLQDYGETLNPRFIEHIAKVVQDVRANGHA